MPHVEKPPEDFRRVLREKALSHSLFYLKLGAGAAVGEVPQRRRSVSRSAPAQPPARARRAQPRVSELLLHFEPGMHYLRPPRAASPDDISSSDDDDRAAVRRRSRDLSDDSAVEVEPRRRQSRASPPEEMSPRRERTLVEAHVVGGRGRTVRTPSVVVSDWSDGVVGATPEEVGWLRARALSADSACSSCSTLSSRDDDDFEPPAQTKKIVNAD